MSRPRIHDEPRITTAVRFPESLHRILRAKAQELDLSVNWLVNRAVEDFLDRRDPRATPHYPLKDGT